tara:strand:+ start:737 stop:1036 length:300 start_codon:yes stop_codon:yes gene_type:complete
MSRWIDNNKRFHWHEPTKSMAIEHIEDIQPLIDSNKKLQQNDHSMKDEFRLSARIPVTVVYEWKAKYGVDVYNPNHKEGVRKLLNGAEYKYLKTTNRRI